VGASAREIEREIRKTRDRMDVNLTRLEIRAASSALRYGRMAAIALGVVALGAAGLVVFKKTRH
jgi:hypothetical protein